MRKRKHLAALAAAASAAAINAGQQTEAASVGVHFRYNYNNGAYVGAIINQASSVIFAGVPSSLWNNMAPIVFGEQTGTTSFTEQFLTTAGATGISLDYSARNAYAPYGPVTDSNAAYFSYLDDGGAGYKVTIHGLSTLLGAGETYKLTALQSTDSIITNFGDVFIYAGTDTTGTLLATLSGATAQLFPGNVGSFGDTLAATGLIADTITIVGEPRNGAERSTLAGLAIQSVPEPGSVAIVLGGLGLMISKRRRREQASPGHQT